MSGQCQLCPLGEAPLGEPEADDTGLVLTSAFDSRILHLHPTLRSPGMNHIGLGDRRGPQGLDDSHKSAGVPVTRPAENGLPSMGF